MKKLFKVVSFLIVVIMASCSSDDNSASYNINSKEDVIKGLKGEWKRTKIVNITTNEELSKEDFFVDSFTYLNFTSDNVVLVTWYLYEKQNDPGRREISTFEVGDNGNLWIKAPDEKEINKIDDLYLIQELTNKELVIYNNNNRHNVKEVFIRVK